MIMRIEISCVALAALVAVCQTVPAHSTTIRNLDKSEHRIVVVEGESSYEHKIASEKELAGICRSICNIYVGEDPDPYEILAEDKVEIEDGLLNYSDDSQNAPSKR